MLDTISGKAELGIKGGYNFVDVRDVAKAIYDLSKTGNRGQYIISGHSVSVVELYQKINEYKGLKKKPIIFPTWLAKMACPFVKVLNKITIKALQEPHDYSSEKATKDFGYQPTDIDQTIRSVCDWFAHNKEIFAKKKEK